jgi:opacity protein-like surface antigen
MFMISAAVAGLSLAMVAQSTPMTPTVEVFGGYSWMRQSASGASQNYNGFNASVNANLNNWLGVGGQFGGYFHSVPADTTNGIPSYSLKTQTYLFGPTVTMRNNPQFTPFFHALFGRVSDSVSSSGVSASTGAFGYGFGGGIDYNMRPNLAIRAVQADWIRASFSTTDPNTGQSSSTAINHIRISTGIVFRFGGK